MSRHAKNNKILKTLQTMCPISKKITSDIHLRLNTTDKKNVIECSQCRTHVLEKNFSTHLKIVHRSVNVEQHDPEKKTCLWCKNYTSKSKVLMKRHLQNAHAEKIDTTNENYFTLCPPSFSCRHPICPFKSYTTAAITWHEHVVHEKSDFETWSKTFLFTTCVFCKIQMLNSDYLKHKKTCKDHLLQQQQQQQ